MIVKDAAGNPIVNANFHVQMENVLANWSPKNGGELEALFPGTGLVVVTAGSAELRLPVSIVAGPLFALDVTPASGSVALGQEIQFVANGLDEQGFPTDETGLVWSTTLGEISSTGLWKATQAGEGTVTARLGTFEVTVKVVVGQ